MIVAVAGIGAAMWGLFKLRTVVDVACGYKSKVLCTAVFASRRALDPRRADEIAADSYWILRPFRSTVDATTASVTTSLAGLRPRTAFYREGFGATLSYGAADSGRGIVGRVSEARRGLAVTDQASPHIRAG